MPNKNYKRGRETEYKIIELFKAVGCQADRTAGSHGVFDVVVRTPLGTRYIQAKRVKQGNNWTSEYKDEVEKIRQLPKIPGATYEYWIWEDYKGFIKQEVVK